MRIGFVLDDSLDKTDGVQQYVLCLGKWFQQQGHQVHYLVGQTERTDLAHIHSLSRNIQMHFNQNRMSTPLPAPKNRIRQLLAEEDFDVLHVQLPYSPLMAGRVIKQAAPQTAIIGTFHIIPATRFEALATKLLRLLIWRSLRRFHRVFSVSAPAKTFAARSLGRKSSVLPNVVNVGFYQSGKKLARYQDGKVNIVFVGRLVERKGCRYLLEALAYLHERNELQNVRVLICGKGPLENELKEFVTKHHLGSIVRFKGYVSETEKANYLASAQLAVFPSTGGESFGIVLIEAMAADSEVVLAGENIGYRSVMTEKSQLVRPRDTLAFARSLRHFIRNRPARLRSQAWQRQHIRQYDVRVVGPELLRAYEQAIAKAAKAGHNTRKHQ